MLESILGSRNSEYDLIYKTSKMHEFMQNISYDNPFYDSHSSCKKLRNQLDQVCVARLNISIGTEA